MSFSLVGLVLLASANSYPMILVAATSVGLGSSIFHPEASRLARLASGGRYGFAQSLFQVGGNAGQSLGPLLAALVIGARARSNVIWFTLVALVGIIVLYNAGRWYRQNLPRAHKHIRRPVSHTDLPPAQIRWALFILISLIFSKFFYLQHAVKPALIEAFQHGGPALIEVVVNRKELSMPPTIKLEQAIGFNLWAIKAVLSGRGNELVDLAASNLLR